MPKKIINVAKMWLQNGYLPQLAREDIGWLQFFLEITWSTHGGNNYGRDRSQEFCGLFYRIQIVKKNLLSLETYPLSYFEKKHPKYVQKSESKKILSGLILIQIRKILFPNTIGWTRPVQRR